MKNKDINNEDKWLKAHYNAEDEVKSPSSNFTHKVMQKIKNEELKPAIKPLPLFGWMGWIITSVFVILIALSIIFSPESSGHKPVVNVEIPEVSPIIQSESFIALVFIISAISILMIVDQFIVKKFK